MWRSSIIRAMQSKPAASITCYPPIPTSIRWKPPIRTSFRYRLARATAPKSQDGHPAYRCRPRQPLSEIRRGQARSGLAGRTYFNHGPRPAKRSPAANEMIGFAAEPRQLVVEGTPEGSSPYAAALLKHLPASPGYDFGQVMAMVTEEVYLATGTPAAAVDQRQPETAF